MKGGGKFLLAAFAVVLGVLLGVALLLGPPPPPANASCVGGPAVDVTTGPLPASVAGYSGPQLVGAAAIMQAAKDKGLDVRAQTIGVMTSMGESGLTAVNHGDAAGPDSLGWFQQRFQWGPAADRLNAYASAVMFFTGGQGGQAGLISIPGWESMPPTLAAHAVQRNADPLYYTRFWDPAVQVVAALAGVPVSVQPGTGGQVCTAQGGGSTQVAPSGWADPVPGAVLSSGFGARSGGFHYGQDMAAPLGTPIYAAAAGTVISSGPASGYGDWIRIDHGGGVVTIYGHMYPQDLLVRVGDTVTAGQQIARVGNNGESTGPHCHFQVEVNGVPVDPVPFMAARGVTL